MNDKPNLMSNKKFNYFLFVSNERPVFNLATQTKLQQPIKNYLSKGLKFIKKMINNMFINHY